MLQETGNRAETGDWTVSQQAKGKVQTRAFNQSERRRHQRRRRQHTPMTTMTARAHFNITPCISRQIALFSSFSLLSHLMSPTMSFRRLQRTHHSAISGRNCPSNFILPLHFIVQSFALTFKFCLFIAHYRQYIFHQLEKLLKKPPREINWQ